MALEESTNPLANRRENFWSTLQTYSRALPVAVLGLDRRHIIRVANGRALEVLGLPSTAEITGRPVWRLHEQLLVSPSLARFGNLEEPLATECDLVLKSGATRRVDINIFPVRISKRTLGTMILGEDVTERYLQERERLTTKRALIHLDGIDIFLFDKNQHIVFCNRLPDTAVGLDIRRAASLADSYETPPHPELVEHVARLLEADGPDEIGVDPVEIGERSYRFNVQRLGQEPGQAIGLAVFAYDVSEETRLKAQLHRAEQLALIGDLAHNTAHELRNPLSAIRAMAQLATRLEDTDAKNRGFTRILTEVDRLDRYIEDLLLLPQAPLLQLAPQNLTEILEEVLVLVQGDIIAQHIDIERNFAADLPAIEGERKLLRRALLNLIVNSIEAMESGGTLTLNAQLLGGQRARSYVQLCIADTGSGMSPEEIERLFSPFAAGQRGGPGLGIAVAHQVITQHHRGRLWFSSKIGQGTLVTIELPAVHPSDDPAS